MKRYLQLLILLVSLCFYQKSYADTFVVTSNADSGPGTLREAITLANANGTGVTDYINFNMADVSEAGRTINLLSELPALTSSVTIDGSTQPGTNLGLSTARIILFLDHFTPNPFTFFFINNASDVKILGIFFYFFDNPDAGGGLNYAIGLRNSHDITIGAPGKGNMFSAVRVAITNSYWNYYNDAVKNVTIQGNVFGRGISNISFRGYIDFINADNIKIGGSTAAEGNLFFGCGIGLTQPANSLVVPFSIIENNIFGFDGTNYYSDGTNITLSGNTLGDVNVTGTIIKNNFAPWGELGLSSIGHRAIIQGNRFGVRDDNVTCTAPDPISTSLCSKVVIGGDQPGEANIVSGISVSDSRTHIMRNTITPYKINVWSYNFPNKPFAKILQYDNGLIQGKSNPNAKIQLYSAFCGDWGRCPDRQYYSTIYADANGDWNYPYTAAMPNLVATATTGDSATSPFTEPFADHSNFVLTHPTCGKSNGSITGIVIKEGTHIKWYNSSTNELVGTDTNLVNVPAGTYSLYVFNGENGCPWGVPFTINDLRPPPFLNPDAYITNASCGQANGSIVTYSFEYGSKWLNANNDSIGTGYYINNLLPGTYYLKLWISYDTSCNRTYGPYIVSNNSGPTLLVDNIQLNSSACENRNGSITNITATSVTGTPFIQWLDSLNNPVGNSLELLNVPAGKYRLKFKDESGCDTIITPYYTIGAIGAIAIDTSGKTISASSCISNTGSIGNIKVTGATGYQWRNTATNAIVGADITLSNVAPGNYQLTATNATGCSAVSPVISVLPGSFNPINVRDFYFSDATCGETNGMIVITHFNKNGDDYTFEWIRKSNGQSVGSGTTILSLPGGDYGLLATDENGCKQEVFTITLKAFPYPTYDLSGVKIIADKCSLSQGSITGVKTKDLPAENLTYTWYKDNVIISDSPSLLNIGAGYYDLQVSGGGCSMDWVSFIVDNNDNAGILPQYDQVTIPRHTAATLAVKNPEPGTYYLYSDAAGTQLIQQNNTGIFTITSLPANTDFYIKHVNGTCSSALVAVKVMVVDKSYFVIPSAFTPNNDGKNDRLNLKVVGRIDVEYFKIFNRNGEEVFSTKTVNDGWNGFHKGSLQPTSVFVWIAKGKDLLGNTITDKGTFVLIR